MRATPLKIITTARRSVHTLIGSNEAFRTRTRAFMVEAILREPLGKCQKIVSERVGSVCEGGTGLAREPRAGCACQCHIPVNPRAGSSAVQARSVLRASCR